VYVIKTRSSIQFKSPDAQAAPAKEEGLNRLFRMINFIDGCGVKHQSPAIVKIVT
jgi:hypothetical protein